MEDFKEKAGRHESVAESFSKWRLVVDRHVGQADSGAFFERAFQNLPGGLRELFSKTLALAAAREKDEQALLLALRWCPPSHADSRGVSLSHFAARWPSPRMLIALAEAGASLLATDVAGKIPLDYAAEAGREACVEALLARGAHPKKSKNTAKTSSGAWRCLHEAAKRGDVEIAQKLIAAGADLDAVDEGGNTPLSVAASRGRLEMVQCLLAKGAGADIVESFGSAPLHAACEFGHGECVEALLASGANAEIEQSSMTALLAASRARSLACVQALARRGANLDATDRDGNTALMIVCMSPIDQCALSIIEALIDAGACRSRTNRSGGSALSVVAARMRTSSWLAGDASQGQARAEMALRAMLLAGDGEDLDQVDIFGISPAMRAAIAGSPEALALLQKMGASLDKELGIGEIDEIDLRIKGVGKRCTLAIFCAATGDLACLSKLWELGVDVLAANSLGVAPKAAAEKFGQKSVAAALAALAESEDIEREIRGGREAKSVAARRI